MQVVGNQHSVLRQQDSIHKGTYVDRELGDWEIMYLHSTYKRLVASGFDKASP
jgi:hypothetical protein